MRRAALAVVALTAVIAIPVAEARPRDPIGQFFKALSGKPAVVKKRKELTYKSTRRAKSAAVKSDRAAKLMPGATDKFTPALTELYRNFPVQRPSGWSQAGVASWYGPGFHGRRTACGQVYNEWGMTAAHRTLKCGTRLEVHSGGKSADVVVTDRGPYIEGRILDLSRGAAQELGIIQRGVAKVTIYVLGKE